MCMPDRLCCRPARCKCFPAFLGSQLRKIALCNMNQQSASFSDACISNLKFVWQECSIAQLLHYISQIRCPHYDVLQNSWTSLQDLLLWVVLDQLSI